MVIGSSHKEPYDVPTHVFAAFEDELGDWVKVDGTTRFPVGQVAPHSREWWVEPGKEQKANAQGDFVGMSGGEVVEGSLSGPGNFLELMYPGIR